MIIPTYIYRAALLRIVDADTYVMDIDLGMRVHNEVNIRLHAFYAPESNTPAGVDATTAVQKIFEGKEGRIIVETFKDQLSFARWIADVYVDGIHVGELLKAAGIAQGGIGIK